MATKEIKTWAIGEVFEDLYEVLEIFEGGMGQVYRVRHRGWGIDLAMKRPRANWLETHPTFADFEHECDVWINLGLHPHVATCHYVRRIEGVPCIFAEFVEGGTLQEWIVRKKLYRGGEDIARARILDIAIQFAWGLEWAHNHRLVHQDVKPGNVLVTADGSIKVTDFGLARTRSADSVVAPFAGGTPAYYSPEQEQKAPVTLATDIWSWAVSVFEMFTGMLWKSGVFAKPALDQFRQRGLQEQSYPPMTPALYEVLRQCFRTAPENRPASMSQIAARLIDIHAYEFGEPYARQPPDTDLLACDALNNRAVSLLDLGEQEQAMVALEEALRCDPLHPEATFNHGIILLRAAKISDEALLGKLQKVAEADPGNSVPLQLVARVHMERGRTESALLVLRSAQAVEPDEGELRAIKQLMLFAANPVSVPPEIARPFVHAVPRTGAQANRDATAMKRLLSKAHAANQAGCASDARRYLDRLRELPGSKRHPEVRRLEEILWRKERS